MPENNDLFSRLLRGFSREPEKASMNIHEKKADGMAEDLRSSLNKILPKDPKHGYTPIQWAVRTSMKEIGNFTALDSLVSELNEDQLRELSERTGQSINKLTRHYRVKGEKTDRESVENSYVIVECNIDHKNLNDPFMAAQKFIHTVQEKVYKHQPDHEEISSDELTPLSQGKKPKGTGALFEAKFTFKGK